MSIHPTAIISKDAEIDPGATIGPFSVIKGKARIGKGTIIESHVTVGCDSGSVTIGEDNHIWPGAVVGGPPQDLKFAGETTHLEIGNGNIIREYVTLNLGTKTGGGITKIGNKNLLMAYVHIAHDCLLSDHVVVANSTQFAGHVEVEDHVHVGGCCGISQFVKIGRYSFIGGDSVINKDILPFCIAEGKWATCRATNKIGLDRAGFSKNEVENIHRAVRAVIKGHRTIDEALAKIEEECEPSEHLEYFVKFIKSSERGVAR